ncbi:MAG: hypothetical protein L0027_13990 [Candidatus Rokubacteria bacterium]|nr:hypothetical protein [Candidatus Rokubacteria bacterium]
MAQSIRPRAGEDVWTVITVLAARLGTTVMGGHQVGDDLAAQDLGAACPVSGTRTAASATGAGGCGRVECKISGWLWGARHSTGTS